MAIIRNATNRKLKGRVGDTTYYVSKGQQVARQAQNNSNYGESASRTWLQQSNRVKWSNCVNFYKASSMWIKKAFETKKSGQTDYNKFMSVNLPQAPIYLTKNMAEAGCCIIAPYIISQGSLPSIAVDKSGSYWVTDIRVGDLTISDSTTVADFSSAVVHNNRHILLGDQLSFVSYQQTQDAFGMPRVICTAYEVTLSETNTESLRNYLPEFCSTSMGGGYLGTNSNISKGGFAYVLSRNATSGKLLVSSQQLVSNNDEMIRQYSSQAALTNAVNSYGLDSEAFLDTGSQETPATPQPQFIEYVSNFDTGKKFAPSSVVKRFGDVMEVSGALITFANEFNKEDVGSVTMVLANSPSTWEGEAIYEAEVLSGGNERQCRVNMQGGSYYESYLKAIVVMLAGNEYRISFAKE